MADSERAHGESQVGRPQISYELETVLGIPVGRRSVFGHDAFLVESEQIADLLSEALHHSDLLGVAA